MIHIEKFVFSPFQENTYVVYNEHKNAWIIDPGCYDQSEKTELKNFIEKAGLTVKKLINTHCHLDHVFGNKFVCDTYKVSPEYHRADEATMNLAPVSANLYGIPGFETSPKASVYLDEHSKLQLDDETFEIRFCPGHAPGHIVLIHHEQKLVINGDVLFYGSIGRTDLPGGNHEQLLNSIRTQLFSLEEDYTVYCGHGPETTIGFEKKHNPFLK